MHLARLLSTPLVDGSICSSPPTSKSSRELPRSLLSTSGSKVSGETPFRPRSLGICESRWRPYRQHNSEKCCFAMPIRIELRIGSTSSVCT